MCNTKQLKTGKDIRQESHIKCSYCQVFYAYTRTETVLRSTTQLLNTGYNIMVIYIYIRSTIIMLNNYIAHHFL